MSEPFSITKMFGGLFTPVHWAKTVMFSLSAGFLILVVIGVWRGYFKKPEPTTSQAAETIYNHYYQPQPHFGCATVRIYGEQPMNQAN